MILDMIKYIVYTLLHWFAALIRETPGCMETLKQESSDTRDDEPSEEEKCSGKNSHYISR